MSELVADRFMMFTITKILCFFLTKFLLLQKVTAYCNKNFVKNLGSDFGSGKNSTGSWPENKQNDQNLFFKKKIFLTVSCLFLKDV